MRHLTSAVCAASLLALAASPALAATHHHKRHHGHVVVAPRHDAPAYGRYWGRPISAGGVNSPGPIYRGGYYLGSDPDPNIRFDATRGSPAAVREPTT